MVWETDKQNTPVTISFRGGSRKRRRPHQKGETDGKVAEPYLQKKSLAARSVIRPPTRSGRDETTAERVLSRKEILSRAERSITARSGASGHFPSPFQEKRARDDHDRRACLPQANPTISAPQSTAGVPEDARSLGNATRRGLWMAQNSFHCSTGTKASRSRSSEQTGTVPALSGISSGPSSCNVHRSQ